MVALDGTDVSLSELGQTWTGLPLNLGGALDVGWGGCQSKAILI